MDADIIKRLEISYQNSGCQCWGCGNAVTLFREVDRLKAELEALKKDLEQNPLYVIAMKDRDLWKSKAEKLAWSLKDLLNHGLQYETGELHQADAEKAKEALKDFEEGKG